MCAVRALALGTIVLSVRSGAAPVEKWDASPGGLVFSAAPTTEELFRAHVFEEPLVPIGDEPSASENAAVAAALGGYAHRSGPDDFSSLTRFLDQHPNSVWRAALLTGLGLEYYNTAHYSLALEAWREAWTLGKDARTAQGKCIADRAGGELAYMYGRLGRMGELEAFLQSVQGRTFFGPGNSRIIGAREGLWMMKNQPEIAFFCGPQALGCIKAEVDPSHPGMDIIRKAASTTNGCSLPQVAELSRNLDLNYQMAFREKSGDFIAPSVVHWKVGHYAALIRKVGDLYLLKDPTFRNDTWATRQALEDETSGYFLVPPEPLPKGWRAVDTTEGDSIWGKGFVTILDPGGQTPQDLHTGPQVCQGMMVPRVHLMTINLSLVDEPVGYKPPVGPAVPFIVRYNSLDGFQPANATYSNFGLQWSSDWISYITDNPTNSLADVYYYIGGGQRTFTFDTNTQAFTSQQYDQTLLMRTVTNGIKYTMLWRDGSQMIFGRSDGSAGTSRKVFLTQVIDPQGNAVTLTYDGLQRLVAITDAIGQVTTITHGLPMAGTGTSGPCTDTNTVAADPYKITKITDPFGRSATFDYTVGAIGFFTCTNGATPIHTNLIYAYLLNKITDVYGLISQVNYGLGTNVASYSTTNGLLFVTNYTSITSLTTPYGMSSFSLSYGNGVNRSAEITYPDGSRDRVEFNPAAPGFGDADPASTVPLGMPTIFDHYLGYRNTFYWSRNACATSYGDYSKARLFHWLHAAVGVCSGILESTKEPLENRVWYGYTGQVPNIAGTNNRPTQIGRVLDNGTTQLYNYTYNAFGRMTSIVDPVGRAFSCIYATNGIDLLEVRMTRAAKNELLFRATYNSQHRPLTTTDAAGQTTSYSYNSRGQLLSVTNARNETLTFDYDSAGYLFAIHGPLPGTNDTVMITYDAFGHPRTLTDVSGYTLTFDYDYLDRVTQITHPDSTFEQITYDRLDAAVLRDRAGRLTLLNHDSLRQLTQITDPLERVTRLSWCRCGALSSLTDPLGRTTSWQMDIQGRPVAKQYADGSQITYAYENATSRLRQVTDEKQQQTFFAYNLDNTFRLIAYGNATVSTPAVSFTYDPDYERVISVTDGTGPSTYSYVPITVVPTLGAGRLASVTGPLPTETITYAYDELGRRIHRAINGVDLALSYDAAGRVVRATNMLGSFSYSYDGSSFRLLSKTLPNGQTTSAGYGSLLQDLSLQRITHQMGAAPLSEFTYTHDIPAGLITTWSQQAGTLPPNIYSFGYDDANQLLSATVTNSGAMVNTFAYSYDPAANRLTERAGASTYTANYNALNQFSTTTAPGSSRTNEWDAANRLTAVNAGNQRTEFTYDDQSRLMGIRKLVNGAEVSHRLFVWDGRRIREEHDTNGLTTKRFFAQGVQIVTGTNTGTYYYTRDHLGSIREVTDASGDIRARYTYDPFGRRTKVNGDVEADFGFAGMFWSSEASLALTHFRAYDPELGRWLSRDPLYHAETREGPNLYAYVRNEPVGLMDPLGLEIKIIGNAFDFYLAVQYLGQSPLASKIVDDLIDSSDLYTIQIGDFDNQYIPSTKTIFWNPHSALVDDSVVHSPALGLCHEMGHADYDPDLSDILASARIPNTPSGVDWFGGSFEESRVIFGVELPVAFSLGEAIRLDHYMTSRRHVDTPFTR
jgi:RHS repeat-associated protein